MPVETYFAPASELKNIWTAGSITATGAKAGVDIRTLDRDFMVVMTGIKIAGTNPTLAVKLQHAPDANLIDTVGYVGTGDGTCTQIEAGPDTLAEDITITFSSATEAAVVGGASGSLGTATVGTVFTSPYVSFLLTAGETAFVNTDAFTIATLARTYADVTGGAFTGLTTTGSIQKKAFHRSKIGPFIRAHFTIGGTVSPEYIAAVALFGMK